MELQDIFAHPKPREEDVLQHMREKLDESGREIRRPLRMLLDANNVDNSNVFADKARDDTSFPENFVEGEHVWAREEIEALEMFSDDEEISAWLCGRGRKCLLVVRLFEDRKDEAKDFVRQVYKDMNKDVTRNAEQAVSPQ